MFCMFCMGMKKRSVKGVKGFGRFKIIFEENIKNLYNWFIFLKGREK